jgi:two-component system KDP operon response regulator KdpE
LVRITLEQQRYRLIEAESGQLGLQKAAERPPDVVILELDLPDMDGLTVLRSFREWSQTPVLVLSERGGTADKVKAFDAGANDYLTKPFDTAELAARLRVLQRTLPGVSDGPRLMEGDLQANVATHEVTLKGCKLGLTPTEEALFFVLVQHAGKVVTREHLLRSIWGTHTEDKNHDLQVYIAQLRKKLGSASEILIQTAGSIGYRLALAAGQEQAAAAPTQCG